jgi:uncharacterized protein (DUF1810 family)
LWGEGGIWYDRDMSKDDFDLERFVEAQGPVYRRALAEIQTGEKLSHWMWFIFPQVRGLGRSEMSLEYGIGSREEAIAYLAHPVLGARLRECAEAALAVRGRTAREIFGQPDDTKLRSSATLFATVSEPGSVFERVIDTYFEGKPDRRTLELLGRL